MDDSKAYTRPWVNPPKLHKLEPTWEIAEWFCVIDEENAYSEAVTSRHYTEVKEVKEVKEGKETTKSPGSRLAKVLSSASFTSFTSSTS